MTSIGTMPPHFNAQLHLEQSQVTGYNDQDTQTQDAQSSASAQVDPNALGINAPQIEGTSQVSQLTAAALSGGIRV